MTTVAWVLDLDADLELADPENFRASHRQAAQAATWGERFLDHARYWAPTGVAHVAAHVAAPKSTKPAPDTVCQAFCPTPRAIAAAAASGLQLTAAPPVTVLQRVNDRAFAAGLGGELPGRAIVHSLSELDATIRNRRATHGWLLKRLFGFSGRGHKRVAAALTATEQRWVEGALSLHGALLVEPFVELLAEFVLHGWLRPDGSCWFGEPVTQRHDARGGWVETTAGAASLTAAELASFRATGATVARELNVAGYAGPFAIDGYRFVDHDGPRFEPLSEINARYTMGWFVGIGDRQREWIAEIT